MICPICHSAPAETFGLCRGCAPAAMAEMRAVFDRWRDEEERDCSLEIHIKGGGANGTEVYATPDPWTGEPRSWV